MRLAAIVICILTSFLMACGSNTGGGTNKKDNRNNYPIKNTKAYNGGPIIVFGDSVANGYGASSKSTSLNGCMASVPSWVVNVSSDGATTSDSLSFLDDALNEKPSIVLISLGGNDVINDAMYGSLAEEVTLKNIRKIFRSFTDNGSLVIHLGLNPPRHPVYPADSSRLQKFYTIAVEEGVIFLENSFAGLWGNSDYMSDEIHPNDKGYSILCTRVMTALNPHLK